MSGWMLISDAMVPSLQPQAGGCRSLWRYPVCVCVYVCVSGGRGVGSGQGPRTWSSTKEQGQL